MAGAGRGADQKRDHEQVPERLDAHEHRDRDQTEQRRIDEKRPRAEGRRAGSIEADREERAMEGNDCAHRRGDQEGRDHEVATGHAEQIAEEQAVESRRRARREGEHDTEPEESRDHDRHAGVAPEPRRPSDERDPGRCGENAQRAPGEER